MKKINPCELKNRVDMRIEEDINSGRVLGANVFVCQDNETVLKKSYGYQNRNNKKSDK